MNTLIKTTCPYCGVGCGVEAEVDAGLRRVAIRGDQAHPANFGRLCSKGAALGDTIGLEGRLLHPRIHGQTTDWNQALNLVADALRGIIERYGPDAVALYGSGQLLTEDYYVANKLMKGFIGTANIDTNSRLCMSSSVAGHKRAFGADIVPGCYEDYESADMIVLIGSNAAWCHPVSFQRIRAAKATNPDLKIVVIDPRKTASCDIADLHLALASGSDAVLFNGLLHYLNEKNRLDSDFVSRRTEGFAEALAAANFSIDQVSEHCDITPDETERFYRWFTDRDKVVSLYSQGINQSSSGTDKVNAIINCHLATGRIGKPGMGPFSLTGQPNAMGGREVGGLAHQLAAHMDFANPNDIDRVARFWGSPNIARDAGYPAVELFDAVYDGKVKAIWIMGTNPAVSLPNADKVKEALKRCEFVVVSDCMEHTDTTALAHVLLPAQGWSEKDGTVTNSERRISRQRALFPSSGESRPDWWIIGQVAKRLGFGQAFAYRSAVEIFREHAALSGFENDDIHGRRDFDISAFADISQQTYDNLQPIQWPVNQDYPHGRSRFFDDGRFFTASGKAQFVAVCPSPPVNAPDKEYPLILNTGRLRDQWHTMTRTGLSAKLSQHRPEVFAELHPKDAERYGLLANGLAILESAWGTMLARVQISDALRPGNVFVPMHWNGQYAKRGGMGALINPVVDPLSKQPESKHTPVRIKPYLAAWYGFVLSRHDISVDDTGYWVKSKGEDHFRTELAGDLTPPEWRIWAKNCLQFAETEKAEWLEYLDSGTGEYRAAHIEDGRLVSVLFVSPHHGLPHRNWLSGLFVKKALDRLERNALLNGLPPAGVVDSGAIVCACFDIGEKTIQAAIKQQGLKTVQDVGRCLKAGTNCGSCIPEIRAML